MAFSNLNNPPQTTIQEVNLFDKINHLSPASFHRLVSVSQRINGSSPTFLEQQAKTINPKGDKSKVSINQIHSFLQVDCLSREHLATILTAIRKANMKQPVVLKQQAR